MKRNLAFASAAGLTLLIAAWVTIGVAVGDWTGGGGFSGQPLARAVWVSAAMAIGVQILAFGLVWRYRDKNPIAGWGLGSLLRFAVLMGYAFVGAEALGLPLGPALLSLAGFLFVTMLLEPIFLRK